MQLVSIILRKIFQTSIWDFCRHGNDAGKMNETFEQLSASEWEWHVSGSVRTRQHKRVCSLTRSYLESSGDFRRAHGQAQKRKTEEHCGDVCFVLAVGILWTIPRSRQPDI